MLLTQFFVFVEVEHHRPCKRCRAVVNILHKTRGCNLSKTVRKCIYLLF